MSRTQAPAKPLDLEIVFDKASKFYEPGETVTGTVKVLNRTSMDHGAVVLTAEAYMDTVSAIRGNVGRQPLPADQRIYFMKKQHTVCASGRTTPQDLIKFNFQNEASSAHPLIDAYVGVDFSIVYKVSVSVKPKDSGKALEGNAQYYCMV